ncbi:EamA family transporter, partial [Candidatus Saccharibacteria bacterium]|nr:EamA family transporter [Candidatus Saccharibacteria bacterium]
GATGIVAPISNSYAILTAFLSALLLGHKLSLLGYLAVVVIVLGIALLTYRKDPAHNKKDFQYSVNFSLMALVFFGVGFILFDLASNQHWYQNNMFFQLVGGLNALLIYILWVKKDLIVQAKQIASDPLLYVGSTIATAGTIGFFAALANVENVAVPAAIAAASPLVTAFLAYFFDKEHLTILQRFATFVIVGGIVLISV